MHDQGCSDRDDVYQSVIRFLDFSPQNIDIAREIARNVSESGLSAQRSPRLSARQQLSLAVRACIRHTYTAYDDVLIENSIEQADLGMGGEYGAQHDDTVDAVTEFIERHRR